MSGIPKGRVRGESFLRGALLITLAGLVSRILGAIYKPIVARLFAPFDGHMGDAGLGLVQVPAPAYLIILSVSAIGINIAISRLVAERVAQGRPAAAWQVFKVSFVLMALLGSICAGAFFVTAPMLARWVGRPETAIGFQAIAPAILLVSMMAALRGLFQGYQQMAPYASSQIIEQLVRIGAGVFLVYWLTPHSVALGAAGYNFGPAAGGAAGLAYLTWRVWRWRGELAASDGTGSEPLESPVSIVRQVLVLAAPISVIGAVESLVMLVDSMLVINRLEAVGTAASVADSFLGQLGNSFSLILLPPILTSSLYISLMPAITEALAKGDMAQVRNRAATAYRLTLLFGLPATVGIWALAGGLYRLFFLGDGGSVLAALAPATLFLMLQQTSAGILQGKGDIIGPLRNFGIALILKVVLTYWWTAIPQLGAAGAAHATVAAFAVSSTLNLWSIHRQMGRLVSRLGSWLRPAAAASAMGLAAPYVYDNLTRWTGSPRFAVVLAIAVLGALYFTLLILIRGLRSRDLDLVPWVGPALSGHLRRMRLLMD